MDIEDLAAGPPVVDHEADVAEVLANAAGYVAVLVREAYLVVANPPVDLPFALHFAVFPATRLARWISRQVDLERIDVAEVEATR